MYGYNIKKDSHYKQWGEVYFYIEKSSLGEKMGGGNLCLKENNKRKDVELYLKGKLKKVSLLVMSQY